MLALIRKREVTMNPLVHLIDYGQSFWLDNIRRGFTRAGSLADLVANDGLRGVTSNPSIFEKAVGESDDYDDSIRELAAAGKSPAQMYDTLTTDDIREACDVFTGLYDQTKAGDGLVSIELPPHLASDTDGSIAEGLRLWPLVGRPNAMVKVPATDAGMPVIRRLIAEGINVNITLMFGAEYYEKVIDAYFSGLEDRLAKNLPVNRIASVASFFMSRVATETDPRLQAAIDASTDDAIKAKLSALLGKIAIANSKQLYTVYLQSIESPRWKKL